MKPVYYGDVILIEPDDAGEVVEFILEEDDAEADPKPRLVLTPEEVRNGQ